MKKYEFHANGKPVSVEADSHYPLLWALRDDLKLTGTKFGCGIGECSVCLVDVDGKPTHSCLTPVSRVVGKKVTTIEGLTQNGKLTKVQQAWIDEQVPQCGWCQSGQIIRAEALLRETPKPTDEQIDKAMSDVYCRCGTYTRIRCAIKRASGQETGCDHPVPTAAAKHASPTVKAKVSRHEEAPAHKVSDGLRFGTFYRRPGRFAHPEAAVEQLAGTPSAEEQAGTFSPNAWVTITRDGTTIIESSHSEQGQGILTGIMATIVDEADSDWEKVEIFTAPLTSDTPYLMHSITGGFTMTDDFGLLGHAGATVRMMMKTAAAKVWNVPVEEVETHKGEAHHKASGRKTTYGELVPTARDLPIPSDFPLKSPDERQLIGKWIPRVDIPAKVDGSAVYPMDIDLPGMLVGVPVIGYTYGSTSYWYDDSATLRVPGVKQVVKVPVMGSGYPEALVVLADNYHNAYLGAQHLQVDWNDYPADQLNSDDIAAEIRVLANQPGLRKLRDDGDVEQALAGADRVIERYFATPHLAHLLMAPMNAVANVHDGKVEIWAGLAAPIGEYLDFMSEFSFFEHPQDIIHHQVYTGGQFGRAADWDHTLYAVFTSMTVGAPVKIIYDRVTSTRADMYWPASGFRLKVGVDKAGKPVAWQTHKVINDMSHTPRWAGMAAAWERTPDGQPYNPFPFRTIVDEFAYPVANYQVQHTDPKIPVPFGWLRGVGAQENTFTTERMLDDLADLTGIDPLAYRKSLIKDERLLTCLDSVAARGQWGKDLPANSAQGLATAIYAKTRVACLAEVSVSDKGKITIDRITIAVDPGIAIDPGSIHAQVEGGAIFGLSNLLYGGIDIIGGGTAQANLDTTKYLRFNEAPKKIDVAIISTENHPGAIGEPGSLIVYGAVGNAVSRASGVKQYSYPIKALNLIPSPNP
jgi:isoquinoline 1-oxidoreductase beta subunit